MNVRATLRQWTFPREFRIAPPVWPPHLLEQLEAITQSLVSLPASEPTADGEEGRRDFLADLATSLWRLRSKLLEPNSGRPTPGTERAFRHLEAMWDAVRQAGIEIRDHTGQAVPEGGIYRLKVIAYQPTAGLSRETVIETIKPTIHSDDQMIQMGEVIVGVPETS